jgi:hypothetical protein
VICNVFARDYSREAAWRERRRGERRKRFVLDDVLGEADRRVATRRREEDRRRHDRAVVSTGRTDDHFFLRAGPSLESLIRRFVLRLDDVGRVRLRRGCEQHQAEHR